MHLHEEQSDRLMENLKSKNSPEDQSILVVSTEGKMETRNLQAMGFNYYNVEVLQYLISLHIPA